jgi:2-phosphoglycerate kinase
MESSLKAPIYHRDWKILLVGGSSGVGKTLIAREIGLRFGIPWLQVDDLRLAFQWSHVTLPEHSDALYLFQNADRWQLSPEEFCKGLIAVGEVMSIAIEIIIDNHVATDAPIVIEGDGILPSLFARPIVQKHVQSGYVRSVFLLEREELILYANMLARGRGVEALPEAELRTETHAKWLYGQWLAEQASRFGIPALEARPWATLLERILTASYRPSG